MNPSRPYLEGFDPEGLSTPCFVIDRQALERNASILSKVAKDSGCKILLALKAFACTSAFEILRPHLHGVCASSPHEAKLGRESFGKEVHSYAPAYSQDSLAECLENSNHIVFNTPSQWNRFKKDVLKTGVSPGIRVNPKYSEQETPLYDPCAEGSRLGTPIDQIADADLDGIEGLHLHTLCEQGFGPLERTVTILETKLGTRLGSMKWLNLGGGHHITQPDYDIDGLVKLLKWLRETYGLQLYLEPGEAVAINTGALVCKVLDTMENGMLIAILDTSVTCHLPDVLEMPYRPEIVGAGVPGEYPYTYRLGGQSCLAGDVAGNYSFSEPLKPGQVLIFEDMSHYTMVKTTTFNGVQLPSIAIYDSKTKSTEVVAEFGYEDFKKRLG